MLRWSHRALGHWRAHVALGGDDGVAARPRPGGHQLDVLKVDCARVTLAARQLAGLLHGAFEPPEGDVSDGQAVPEDVNKAPSPSLIFKRRDIEHITSVNPPSTYGNHKTSTSASRRTPWCSVERRIWPVRPR